MHKDKSDQHHCLPKATNAFDHLFEIKFFYRIKANRSKYVEYKCLFALPQKNSNKTLLVVYTDSHSFWSLYRKFYFHWMFKDISSNKEISHLKLPQRVWMHNNRAQEITKGMNVSIELGKHKTMQEYKKFKLHWSIRKRRKA